MKGLDLVRERKRDYRENGIAFYRPWVFLITDGAPTDDWSDAAAKVKRRRGLEEPRLLRRRRRGREHGVLRQIAVREPLRLQGLKFRSLFQWLSNSMKSVSRSTPGDACRSRTRRRGPRGGRRSDGRAPGRWRTVAASVAGTPTSPRTSRARTPGRARRALPGGGRSCSRRSRTGRARRSAGRRARASRATRRPTWPRSGPAHSAGLDAFDAETARDWVEHVRARVGGVAAAEGRRAAGLRRPPCSSRSWRRGERGVLQVGDGAIVYRGRCALHAPALWPQSGEYANTTWFVTDAGGRRSASSSPA